MSDWSPKSLWDRLRRTIEDAMDEDADVDDASIAFHLLFIAPLFIGLVALLWR
jgi:hypothetical protein